MATSLARIAVRHRVLLPVLAALVLAGCGAFGVTVFDRLLPYGAETPGSDSIRTKHAIERDTGAEATPGLIVLTRPAEAAAAERVLRADDLVARVGRRDGALLVSFRPRDDRVLQDRALELKAEVAAAAPSARSGGFVLANADANRFVEEDILRAELFAVPLIVLLAFFFFRGLVAALIPPLVGGLAVLVTLLGLRLATGVADISVYAVNISTGLGLGLAIDYSLLFVSRYREERAERGGDVEASLAATLRTAGRTVAISSVTVTAALAALLVFPQRFLYSMGLGGAIVAAAAASITLLVLPSLLALLGDRINALAPARLQRARARESAVARDGRWYRLATFVGRRPGRFAIVTTLVLLAAGVPFLRAEFAAIDERVLPAGTETAEVAQDLRRAAEGGVTTPVTVRTAPGAAQRLAADARRVPGIASVTEPRGGVFVALLGDDAMSPPSQRAVEALRALPGPPHGVTGPTAEFLDTRASITSRLPLAAVIVAVTSGLAIFLLTGSVVLPVKAVLMNFLTLAAVLGILVLVFQDGRLEGLLGYEGVGTLELTMPVLLFATAFGLSTDYGVFLLARIKEEHDRGLSNREAVAVGLERTGRIVTAAALLFCVAFGSFLTCRLVFMKEAGLGVAAAVLIDATLVRALLVPALMALLGDWNWWAPRRLRRLAVEH